jgi:hypothetical protein
MVDLKEWCCSLQRKFCTASNCQKICNNGRENCSQSNVKENRKVELNDNTKDKIHQAIENLR